MVVKNLIGKSLEPYQPGSILIFNKIVYFVFNILVGKHIFAVKEPKILKKKFF